MRERLPKVYSHELVELIFVQPYCRIQNLVEAGMAHRETASKTLKDLAGLDVPQQVQAGREKLFIHPKFIEMLKSDAHPFKEYAKPPSSRVRATPPALRRKR